MTTCRTDLSIRPGEAGEPANQPCAPGPRRGDAGARDSVLQPCGIPNPLDDPCYGTCAGCGTQDAELWRVGSRWLCWRCEAGT